MRDDLVQRFLSYGGCNEDVDSYRRRYKADTQHYYHYYSEVYQIDAVCLRCRAEDRGKDQTRRYRVDEAACYQQHHAHCKQEYDRAAYVVYEHLSNGLRDTCSRDDPAEYLGRSYDEHDARRAPYACEYSAAYLGDLDLTVYEDTDDQAVEAAYCGCFRWCEQTGVDTTQDDDRGEQSPDRFYKSA